MVCSVHGIESIYIVWRLAAGQVACGVLVWFVAIFFGMLRSTIFLERTSSVESIYQCNGVKPISYSISRMIYLTRKAKFIMYIQG